MLEHREKKGTAHEVAQIPCVQSSYDPESHPRVGQLPLLKLALAHAKDHTLVRSALEKLENGNSEVCLSERENKSLQVAVGALRDSFQAQLVARQNHHSFDYSAPEQDWGWREEVLRADSQVVRFNEVIAHLEFELYLLELSERHPHGFRIGHTLYTTEEATGRRNGKATRRKK